MLNIFDTMYNQKYIGENKMSFKGNRIIISMIVGAVMFAAYLIYAFSSNAPAQDDLSGWAKLIITFLVIAVVVMVAAEVVCHVIFGIMTGVKNHGKGDREIERIVEMSSKDDEMDWLIGSRSDVVGYSCMSLSFIVILLGIAFFEMSAVLALNVVFAFFAIGSIAEGGLKAYYYERGIRNG